MAHDKRLCLNMIVKNEMANLDRCLRAVVDHIDCWVIGDTGSTDGTQDFIKSFFADRGIPGELHSFPFINFEQARNAALEHAVASKLTYDYLLFDDADMELVVEDRDFRAKLNDPGYRLIQRTDTGFFYWNTRMVRREIGARYHGVTHEYIDVPGGVKELRGVWYKDHASGSNRVEKFQRDIDLLTKALKQEPNNERYWFYLAQSYRDAGQKAKAAETYGKRAKMGGFDEEAWNARLQQARCLKDLKDEGGFIREALAAFNQRPQRAEPLYDLARFFRERGDNAASVLFSEFGLTLPRPDDILFLEDFVYRAGLREEYSIAANYSRDAARRDRGFAACNWLALSREIPESTRNLAVSNLHFYVQAAATIMPSFTPRPVGFAAPSGYRPTNPSVTRRGDELLMVQRTVNYAIDPAFPEGDDRRFATPNGEPIKTRNFLLRLDDSFAIRSSAEILPPADMPKPAWPLVQGFEDLRPFDWCDKLWCIACVRELTQEGWCEQVLARIDEVAQGQCQLADWRVLPSEGPQRHEKNWMPLVLGDRLEFIYLCDPTRIVDEQGQTVAERVPPIVADQFRGGSQAIAFDGGWLAVVHEARVRDKQRFYRHRFVWLDAERRLKKVSRPFFLQTYGVEFVAGLAWHPDGKRLVISYGVGDAEAWIATVDAEDVRRVVEDVESPPPTEPNPSGSETSHSANASIVTAKGQQAATGAVDLASGAAQRKKVSGLVISYNRVDVIETCLRSLRFVDELVVVDKTSTDGTLEIARRYADKVAVVPWTPVVEDTRDYALSLCSHDLIVYLDDDEFLSADAIRFILKEAVDPSADVYQLPSRDYYLGHYDKRRRDWPDYKPRFFRRGALQFTTTVHGCPSAKSRNQQFIPADSTICLHHLTSPSVSAWIEKANRYTSQPNRDSWFDKSAPLSEEFVQQRVDYWFKDLTKSPDGYPSAYALMRVAYDIVDRLKRWEAEVRLNGEQEFAALRASLNHDYDTIGLPKGRKAEDEDVLAVQTENSEEDKSGSLLLTEIPISSILMGGEGGCSAESYSQLTGDILRPSTPVRHSPHAELLRDFTRVGDDIFRLSRFSVTPYCLNGLECIRHHGHYFGATTSEGVAERARQFVRMFSGELLTPSTPHETAQGEPVKVKPIEFSECYELIDGSHRLAIALIRGAKRYPCVVLSSRSALTPIQQLIMKSSWTEGNRILYQPIDLPELRGWPVVRGCTDRFEMMKDFLARRGVSSGPFLDIGSGYGWFVRQMSTLGYEATGVDRDAAAVSVGRAVYGLGPSSITVDDHADFLSREDRRYTVVSCLSVLHHYALGRGSISAEEFIRRVDAITGEVLFLDTGEAHEDWFKDSLKEWTAEYTADWLRRNTTFSSIEILGTDQDGKGIYQGQYGRHLFACHRDGLPHPRVLVAHEVVETPSKSELDQLTRTPTQGAVGSSEPSQSSIAGPGTASVEVGSDPSASKSTKDKFIEFAPFLRAVDAPAERREASRAFDARLTELIGSGDSAGLPQIHSFYEVMSDKADHRTLLASVSSMRAAGHPVRVWSYSPQRLDFLLPLGVDVRSAEDVMPRGLFQRIVAGSEIRYFSDIFRYAVLYEHGGLWMDTDVVLLRPFPFRGDYFFNLQWRGAHKGHFVCGNVMYAKPQSRHLRALYEASIDRFSQSGGKEFGDIGPKLLSDYVMSDTGAELRNWLFSPMLFNSIDWTEVDKFNQPLAELADYLNDERVVGVHLWNARTNAQTRDQSSSLISLLSDPIEQLPSLTTLGERFKTDKNRRTGNRHFYTRVYEKLLSNRRLSLRRLMEIGPCRGLTEKAPKGMPSAELWLAYFPFARVFGVDPTDLSPFNNERFSSFICDQSKPDQLRSVAAALEPGSFDVIIDDGSHASFDEQATLREFFPLLADGGWYFIEDLDWQPPGEDLSKIALTKDLLREIQQHGAARSIDPMRISELSSQFSRILFFDSHYELDRAAMLGGLVAIQKRGGGAFV